MCPICKNKLTQIYEHCCQYGVEESKYQCLSCNMYKEVFAYGSTQIDIGDFQTGYHYTTKHEDVDKLMVKVRELGELYGKDIEK